MKYERSDFKTVPFSDEVGRDDCDKCFFNDKCNGDMHKDWRDECYDGYWSKTDKD